MKVLLIKMSSMGDVLHTLPAIEDATRKTDIEITWVVEPAFQDIAQWHPAVKRIIPLPLRTMRKSFVETLRDKTIQNHIGRLREDHYDLILDAQGLIKSALVTKLAKGERVGFDKNSVREKMAAYFYDKKIFVPKNQHAVLRLRQLFSKVFGYTLDDLSFGYGIDLARLFKPKVPRRSILFLHGTTWPTKHWPEQFWKELAKLAAKDGFQVLLPWGSDLEKQRAYRIQGAVTAAFHPVPIVLEKMGLNELASFIHQVQGVVAVDTGLGHLTAALNVPCVSMYGPTDPKLTGTYGLNQVHLQAAKECAPCLQRKCSLNVEDEVHPPCFEHNPPRLVWQHVLSMISMRVSQ